MLAEPLLPIEIKPLSELGLKALQSDADIISLEVTEQYFAKHPECIGAGLERVREMCKVDFQHHMRFLLSAMTTATAEIFENYSYWLKDVLLRRKLDLSHPIDSFTFIKNAILMRLQGDDVVIATLVMDAGLSALQSDSTVVQDYKVDNQKLLNGVNQYTDAIVDGDRKAAELVISKSILTGVDLIDIEVGIIQPAMYEIGKLWQQNRITVAQEHLATAISQNVLARAFQLTDISEPIEKSVICACLEGNLHSLGSRMISDAFEVAGWDSSFFGADTPVNSIVEQVDHAKPDALAISVSLPYQILSVNQLINSLRSEFGAKSPAVIIGGLALNQHKGLWKRLQVESYYQDAKALLSEL